MNKSFLELENESPGDVDVQLNPSPGYVVKTLLVSATRSPKRPQGLKVFINMCSDHQLPEPADKDVHILIAKAEQGLNWNFQVVVSDEKKDVDKAGRSCAVWDCVMHPWFLIQSAHDPVFKVLIIETCLETVEEKALIELSREYTIPKMLSKGELDRPLLHRSELDTGSLTGGLEDLATKISTQGDRNSAMNIDELGEITMKTDEHSKKNSKPLIVELSSKPLEDLSANSQSSYTYRIFQCLLPDIQFKVVVQGPKEQALSSSKLQVSTDGDELYFEDLSIALPKAISKVDAFYVRDKQRMEIFCG